MKFCQKDNFLMLNIHIHKHDYIFTIESTISLTYVVLTIHRMNGFVPSTSMGEHSTPNEYKI